VTVRRDESVLAVEMSTRTLRTTRGELRGMSWFSPPVRRLHPAAARVALPHVYAFRTFADVAAILATRPGGGDRRWGARRRGCGCVTTSW
jgi:nitrite reductase (NADH) large subunit